MKLYLIQFDSQDAYVEAQSFAEAIELWKADWLEEGDYDGEEPESVALVHDEPVIRAQP